MRFLGSIITAASLFFATAALADNACDVQLDRIVATSPYFSTAMDPVKSDHPGQLTFQNKDDPRVIVNFETRASDPADGLARSIFVRRQKDQADSYVSRARKEGRWAESSVFPYEPISWRTIEETQLANIGDGLTGHMELRFSPICTVVADFVSPSSLNLRSRWTAMATAVSDLRSSAAREVTLEKWAPEDTNPVGIPALAGGFALPLAVMFLAFLVLSNITRFESQTIHVRMALGAAFAATILDMALQSRAFVANFAELRFVDDFLLLALVAILTLAGTILGSTSGLLAIISSVVAGAALLISSSFGWTPNPELNVVIGIVLTMLGLFGVYLWIIVERGAFRGVRRK